MMRGPDTVLAPFGGVGDRVVHVGDAAFVDEVDDQLHFVQALEIGHFGRIAGFDQGFEAGADQFDEAAAQHHLFTEQVGLALFLEGGFDDAGTAAADAAGIRQRQVMGVAGGILVYGDQARHAAALLVFAAHRMAGALWRDHDNVDAVHWLDQGEMNVKAMGEGDCSAIADVVGDVVGVDVGLQFVGGRHHHQVGPFGRVSDRHYLQPVGFDLLGGRRSGAESNGDLARRRCPSG